MELFMEDVCPELYVHCASIKKKQTGKNYTNPTGTGAAGVEHCSRMFKNQSDLLDVHLVSFSPGS